jgi:carbon monoxide dehydrogenase subunit G
MPFRIHRAGADDSKTYYLDSYMSATSGLGFYVWPADTVAAPPETVWRLLTDPATYDKWIDPRVESVEPPGPARPGQVVLLNSGALGMRLRVASTSTASIRRRTTSSFASNSHSASGCGNTSACARSREAAVSNSVETSPSRQVGGGWLVERLLGSELRNGPADSLTRLKRVAESAARGQGRV